MSQATALLADAETSIKAGDWDQAIEQLERLKQDQPGEPEVYQKLAHALAVRGKFQSVISTYLELIRVLVESEQLDPADEAVSRVLGLKPESSEARERRIEIENRRGNTGRAVALSRELARLCIDQGDGERSIRLLQDAQKHEPGNLDIALELAEMFVSHGHIQDGANQYRKVANAFQESGNIAKAAEAYRRMKVVQSDDPEVLLTLGRLYTELGKLDEAEQEFRSVLRHDLDHEQALLQLGLVCQLKGRFRSGILAFNKVLQNNPDLVEAKRKLGELHHSQGMMAEAVDFFLKAAQGYLEADEKDDAIECFQIVLSVDENNAPAQQGLTNLGAPVQPKAFEPPQPPAPAEEPAPEPVAASVPEPVAGSSLNTEQSERSPAVEFDGPGAAVEPDPPKPEPASPKKGGGAKGAGSGGRPRPGLTGGGLGGIRPGLVRPGGGDKPMLGGDKPMLGRSPRGIRMGLGEKNLGGPTLGLGDKPVLGGPMGSNRHAGKGAERPTPQSDPPTAAADGDDLFSKGDPLEPFTADMALENVFSDSPSSSSVVAPSSELSLGSQDESTASSGSSELEFGDLASDLFDDSGEAPDPQASGAVLGAFSFDADEEDFAETGGDLRPAYASEKPVFEDEGSDSLFDFDGDPERSAPPATPTLSIGSDLFSDDSSGEDLFGESDSGKSLFDDEDGAGSELFQEFESSGQDLAVSENGVGESNLFDSSSDPFQNLFDDVDGGAENSAETIGGQKPSLALTFDDPEPETNLSGADFGQLFEGTSGDDGSGPSAEKDEFFTPLEFAEPDESSRETSGGLFSDDAKTTDLFQDDELFGSSADLFGEVDSEISGATLFDPTPAGDDGLFDGTQDSTDAGPLGGADFPSLEESPGESLFDSEPPVEVASSATASGGLFAEDGEIGGDLFESFAPPEESNQDEGALFSETETSLFSSDSDFASDGDGLFDAPTPEPSASAEPDSLSGLFDSPGDPGLFADDGPSGGLFDDFAGGEEDTAGHDTSLFGRESDLARSFEEETPLGLDLPMPGDEPVASLEASGGGLFDDDGGDPLFADSSGSAEVPLDFSIPEPEDPPSPPLEPEALEEAPLDFAIPGPQEEPLSFGSSEGDDLFAADPIASQVSDPPVAFQQEPPLDFDIPLAAPPADETSVELSSGDEPLDVEIPLVVEPLDFESPDGGSPASDSPQEQELSFGEGDDLFAVSPSESVFDTEVSASFELESAPFEPSTEDEPDEVMAMLEMTLPSVELAPEESVGGALEVDNALPEDDSLGEAFELPIDGVAEDEDGRAAADPSEGQASTLSEQEQLEIAQTSQADALEESLAGADVASKIAAFRKALEENPDNLVLRTRLADIHLKYGLLEDAVVQYRQVLRRNSDSIPLLHRVIQAEFWNENYVEAGDSLLALAQLHLKRGEHHDALDALQSVLSLDPLHFEARQALVSVFTSLEDSKLAAHHLRQLAETALTKGEISGAILAFQQLLEISDDPTFEERLAQIYESQGDVEKALSSFQSLLGRYRAEERWEEAARVTERIVDLDPTLLEEREGLIALYQRLGLSAQVVEQQYQLARLYQEQGDTERAVALFEDVIKVQVENFDARRHLVDAYLALGRVSSALEQAESLTEHYLDTKDHVTAIALYSRLVDADPENVELQERLVKFYGLAGDPENARSRWIAISHQHEKAERYDKAAEAIQKALELDGNQLDLLQRLAILYAEKLDDHQAALVSLRRLFGLAPEKTEAVKMYIDLLLRAEQVSEAGQVLQKLEQAGGESVEIKANVISSLRASVEANPTDLKARFNYGELCYHLGDLDHAIEQFQQTRRHPDYELMSYNMLGLCFASKRGYMMLDLAINQFKRGLDIKGRPEQDYLETRYNLAMVLYQNSRPAEALAELKECYNVDIAYRDVRSWIQKIESELASSGA